MLFLCSSFSPSPRGEGAYRWPSSSGVAQFASTLGPLIQIPYSELLGSRLSSESPIVGVTFQPSIIIFVTPHNILFLDKSA